MTRKSSGLTLVDVLVALNVLSVLTMMAVPAPLPSSSSSNEANAIATLKQLVLKQAVFKKARSIDEDIDGVGEFGSIGELAGVSLLMRHYVGVQWPLYPPLLPAPFQAIDANGFATSSGYLYVIYLPNNSVTPTGLKDVAGGGPANAVDPNNCEALWCAYAWPVRYGVTGKRAFFVNQSGIVTETSMNATQWSGVAAAPPYSAAFAWSGMNALVATPPVVGVDANDWTIVP